MSFWHRFEAKQEAERQARYDAAEDMPLDFCIACGRGTLYGLCREHDDAWPAASDGAGEAQ